MSTGIELLERAQQGDSQAYGLLYTKYREPVRRFINGKVRNRDLSDDLTQDTFVRALRGIGGFSWQGKDPGAWLMTIARNLVVDHFKSATQRHTISVADYADLGQHLPDQAIEGDPETAVLDRIRDSDLQNALWYLTSEQQECLTNRYLRQLSVAETASAMGREEGAIKSLTYRAVQALTRFLLRTAKA